MASCSSLKPLSFSSSKPAGSAPTTTYAPVSNNTKKEVKFLDDITVESQSVVVKQDAANSRRESGAVHQAVSESGPSTTDIYMNKTSSVEKASAIQLKYAVLLNTEVEQLVNARLLESVDEWYGTRYRMGGTTKSGIDCSAFTQAIYLSTFGVALPRTAREQYRNARIISATELKEGDLVFFNTRGGVSHVGVYLQNNKFVHASSSLGVTVSDMFDPYYLRHYIGAGRIEKAEVKD